MDSIARIALLGFGGSERAAFEAFFHIAGRRSPAYALQADPLAADFVIVDAADELAMATVRDAGLQARAVVLGEPACAGALLQVARPLNLMLVVRALDEVLARRGTVAELADGGVVEQAGAGVVDVDVPAGSPDAPAGPAQVPQAAPARRRRTRKPRAEATTVRARLEAATPDPGPDTEAGGEGRRRRKRAPLDHILVVDDSDIALRFMASHLQRFGFQIHLARGGEEALKRVAERHFEFVFMDVMMEGLDGFQTCKAIKRAAYPEGKKPPTVVMLTCRGSAADKLRGTMAGADAYLTKPLREVELFKVVGDREIERYAYAETAAELTTR